MISYYILLKIYIQVLLMILMNFSRFFKIFHEFSRFFILSDPIWSYLIQLQMSPGDLSLFISRCHFLRFSLFFYVLFKILIILSPIPIDLWSLVRYFTIQFQLLPYYTIFKSVNISKNNNNNNKNNNNNNNNKFVTCWTAYMRKRSKSNRFYLQNIAISWKKCLTLLC